MSSPARTNILGVGVSLVNMEQALDQIDRWIRGRDKTYVCICSVHGVMECQRSEDLREIFNRAGMVTPDGMPLVWLARAHDSRVTRVYGPDLILAGAAGDHEFEFTGRDPVHGAGDRAERRNDPP